MSVRRLVGVSAVVTVRAHRACSLARLAPGLQRPSMGEGTPRQAARAPGSMRLLLQPGRLAQFVGPVGLLPRERGGGLLLAGPVRSEARSVGKEWVRACSTQESPYTY